MSYPTKKTLQYGVTLAQESGAAVHMFRHTMIAIGMPGEPRSGGPSTGAKGGPAGLETPCRGHRMPLLAALNGRHVSFGPRLSDATAPARASWPSPPFK